MMMTTYNRILIALHGIGWMTAQIENVRVQLQMTSGDDKLDRLAFEHDAFLGKIAATLHALMDEVGNYQNNGNMVSDEDVRLMTPAFELLRGSLEPQEAQQA